MAAQARGPHAIAERWDALVAEAHQLRADHDAEGAAALLVEARQLAERAGDPERAVRAELRRATLAETIGVPELRLSAARYALARLTPEHPPVLAGTAHAILANWAILRDEEQTTVVELGRARALLDAETEGSRELCSAVTYLSDVYLRLECYRDARDLLHRARDLCRDVDGGNATAFLSYWLATINLEWSEHLATVEGVESRRRMRECREYALAGAIEATSCGHALTANFCQIIAGIADATLGAPRRALKRLAGVVIDDDEAALMVWLGRARAYRALNDLDGCRTALANLTPSPDVARDLVRRERIQIATALDDQDLVTSELTVAFTEERRRRINDGRRRAAAVSTQVELISAQGRINQRDREIATLRDLSRRDPLTRLLNRRGLEEAVATLAEAEPRSAVGIALIDLDNFKSINDGHSHACGDAVLRRIADHLRASTREQDIIARFAGDEFVIVTPRSTNCVPVAERFRQSVLTSDWTDLGQGLSVTVSIGVAEGHAAAGLDQLVEAADGPLYRAKARGRNRLVSLARSAT